MGEATAFFGANLTAYSIFLFTKGGLGNFGFLGVQVACCIVLVRLGVKYQEKRGYVKSPRILNGDNEPLLFGLYDSPDQPSPIIDD